MSSANSVSRSSRLTKLRLMPSAAYAVYVDENDRGWLSDFGANAVLRFDPQSKTFQSFPILRPYADVRQMLGRAGEVWAAESGSDHLTMYRYD